MTRMRIFAFALTVIVFCMPGQPRVAWGQAANGPAVDARLLQRYTGLKDRLHAELAARIPDTKDEQRVQALLASDALDAKLVTHAVLCDGTPEALASFAQQGKEQEQLVEQLLANPELMKQMLVADGPRTKTEGPAYYGEAMQVYTDIQKASAKAKDGVLQRLAVAIALERPKGKDPVQRYLHFEKAYEDGELDPGFPTLDTWSLRYVVNGNEADWELAWGREMLRNYRPDHIYTKKEGGRYTGVVRSNVLYGSTRQKFDRPELSGYQNILMNGGICGRRAFFGQFICRAFGVPSIKRPSRAHGALARWTSHGWVVNLGPGWGSGWTDTLYKRDKAFLKSSQARRNPDAFLQVKRAEWIGFLMGERPFGAKPGGWAEVAQRTQERVIKESKTVTLEAVDAKFAEADDDTIAEQIIESEISPEVRRITYSADGTILIPAVAHNTPKEELSRFAEMKSFAGGLQAYLPGFGRMGVNLLRGGAAKSTAENCSSFRRIRAARMGQYPDWGFRVAVTPPAGSQPAPEMTLDLGHGVTMQFVYIKPGTFVMGGEREKGGPFDCVEVPKHEVEITKGYYLGKTEVTEAQFFVVGDNPEVVKSMKNPHHPRGTIGVAAAEWFCREASKKTGREVRLPTEAEWEYAARAGTPTRWFFGDDPAKLGEYAWFKDNSGGKGSVYPVAQKKPNPWGLYDMYGNVWERVADVYDKDYFAKSPRKDPVGPIQGEQSRVQYKVNVPRAGTYALSARVVTANYDQMLQVRVNGEAVATRMAMPFTCGKWQDSEPVEVTLKQGENILEFSRAEAPQYGMALKSYMLKPVR